MGYLDELLGYQQQSQISGKGKLQGNQVEAAFRGYIGAQETAAQNSRQLDLQNRQLALQQQAENSREGEFTQSQAQQQSEYTAGLASQQEIAAGQMATGLQETAMGTTSSEKNAATAAAASTANTLAATRSAEAIASANREEQAKEASAKETQGYITDATTAAVLGVAAYNYLGGATTGAAATSAAASSSAATISAASAESTVLAAEDAWGTYTATLASMSEGAEGAATAEEVTAAYGAYTEAAAAITEETSFIGGAAEVGWFSTAVEWVAELWADIELCVIITACTDPHSYEVRISRKYRDQFMSESQLRGYYMMAEKIVPYIKKYPWVKKFVKRWLVDRLVDYGEVKLGITEHRTLLLSWVIPTLFLWSCDVFGRTKKSFVRANGEVF